LISFNQPEEGKNLLKLAYDLTKKLKDNKSITLMNLASASELHHYELEDFEDQQFDKVIEESKNMDTEVITYFKASSDIETDTVNLTNRGNYDLLLMMMGKSIYEGSLLGKLLGFTTRIIDPEKLLSSVKGRLRLFNNAAFDDNTLEILDRSNVQIGVLINKNFEKVDKVFIPLFGEKDALLLILLRN